MATMQWRRFLGQERIREVLSGAFANRTLGHAYLLCGDAGVGTFTAAIEMAMALLCENREVSPCYECSGCRKVMSFSHPDFHIVMPLALAKEYKGSDGKITETGWEELARRVKERINDPYREPRHSAIPLIPVDWIRELTHAIRRGATEKGMNVAIIDGIETMQKESANAMLKTLEEPPEGTILFLCTSRLHAVLPTIVSRCQLLRFAALSPEIIRQDLTATFPVAPDDERLRNVEHVGSICKARQLFEEADLHNGQDAADFWRYMVEQDWNALFAKIDEFSDGWDYGRFASFFEQLLQGIRNAFFNNIEGTENYIIGDPSLCSIYKGIGSPFAAEKLTGFCESALRAVRARANGSLVLINFVLAVMEFYHGKKQ
jgi:DNA polymerase III delta' subunit